MRFSINKDLLLEDLVKHMGVIEKRTTLTYISCIYMSLNDEGQLTLISTNLDMTLKTTLQASTFENGDLLVDAVMFFNSIKAIDSAVINISKSHNNSSIVSFDNGSFNFLGLDTDNYPSINIPQGLSYIPIKAEKLKSLINHTLYAVSTNNAKINLTGAYFETDVENYYSFVTTDSYRLAKYSVEKKGSNQEEEKKQDIRNAIIPRRCLMEIKMLIDSFEDDVLIAIDKNQIYFLVGCTMLSSRLIDFNFPNYSAFIQESEKEICINKRDLVNILRRASIISRESSPLVDIGIEKDYFKFSSVDVDKGKMEEVLPISYDGETYNVNFNCNYFLDCLNVIESDQVVLKFNPNNKKLPLRVESEDKKENYIGILMPIETM